MIQRCASASAVRVGASFLSSRAAAAAGETAVRDESLAAETKTGRLSAGRLRALGVAESVVGGLLLRGARCLPAAVEAEEARGAFPAPAATFGDGELSAATPSTAARSAPMFDLSSASAASAGRDNVPIVARMSRACCSRSRSWSIRSMILPKSILSQCSAGPDKTCRAHAGMLQVGSGAQPETIASEARLYHHRRELQRASRGCAVGCGFAHAEAAPI